MTGRPRRALEWREEDGRCVLLRLKLGRSRLGRWLAARFADPYYRIRLDEVGSLVWRNCDGETDLAAIAARMRQAFGSRIEPAEERLSTFVHQMAKAKLIEL